MSNITQEDTLLICTNKKNGPIAHFAGLDGSV